VLRRGDALRSLLTDLCRATVPPYDAPVCTLLGWVGYAAGEGAVANVAVDRALASEPTYSLALLLREFLHHQVPPREVRRLLRQLPRERARAS
ncbi:MAG TPA: DUF4192 family protein, partial [Mycobacteriales bacterium]|nr:DUF4192 family protein [Mycobacteriales bacterium]